MAYARVFGPGIDRTDIDLDHDKYEWEKNFPLWRYDHMLIFTKWRLDNVISQGQGWKPYCALSSCQ